MLKQGQGCSSSKAAAASRTCLQHRHIRPSCLGYCSRKASVASRAQAHSAATSVHHKEQQQTKQRPPASLDSLKNPAHIGAKASAVARLNDLQEDVSLDTYMRLPIEQYYILDPNQIQFLQGNRFILSVPRIDLFGSWLEPSIEVEVFTQPDAVTLVADHCQIKGTGPLASLNGRFALSFTTRLTWNSQASSSSSQQSRAPSPEGGNSNSNFRSSSGASVAAIPATSNNGNSSSSSSSQGLSSQGQQFFKGLANSSLFGRARPSAAVDSPAAVVPGEIGAAASVDVWCEVISPFHLMPRNVLESTCNTVMSGMVNTLLPVFLRQLAADYQKWATDAAYRAQRAARSSPIH